MLQGSLQEVALELADREISQAAETDDSSSDEDMATTTPSRRSARVAASRGNTPGPAPSVAGSVRSNRTLGRTAAKKNGALPALSAIQSHAYGAAGQTLMATELAVGSASFASAFDQGRATAAERDDEAVQALSRHASVALSESRSEIGIHRRRTRDNLGFDETTLNDTTTSQDISKSFGEDHEGGMDGVAGRASAPALRKAPMFVPAERSSADLTYRAPVARQHGSRRESRRYETRHLNEDGTEPSWFEIAVRFWIRWFAMYGKRIFFTTLGLLLILLTVPFSQIAQTSRGVALDQARYVDSVLRGDFLKSSIADVRHLSWDSLKNFQNHAQQTELRGRLSEIEKVLQNLPDKLLVERNKETGELKVMDDFWHTLTKRLLNEGIAPKDTVAQWRMFLHRNEGYMKNWMKDQIGGYELVSAERFTDMVKKELEDTAQKLEELAQAAGSQAAVQEVRKLPIVSLNAIAQANLVANTELALKSINFFSPTLGAIVDPYLTSPTQLKQMTLAQSLFTRPKWKSARPPIAALQRWEEAGDAWCAAPSDKGKAQIAVLLPHAIYPKKVTVEHVPKEGTPDPKSAPKNMELWVEIRDAEERERVGELAPKCDEHSSLPTSYVCIGQFEYNIQGVNHVQTFPLAVDTELARVPINKAVVRVTENWGRDWTCLYRLRLHGEMVKSPFDEAQEG